jgi:hypothetical protein
LGSEAAAARSAHPTNTRIYRAFLPSASSLPNVSPVEAIDSELLVAAVQLQAFHP